MIYDRLLTLQLNSIYQWFFFSSLSLSRRYYLSMLFVIFIRVIKNYLLQKAIFLELGCEAVNIYHIYAMYYVHLYHERSLGFLLNYNSKVC